MKPTAEPTVTRGKTIRQIPTMKIVNTIKRSVLFAILMAFAATSVHAKFFQQSDAVKKSYDVQSGGTLYLDLDHGNVEVGVTSGERVLIEVERSVDGGSRSASEEMLERHKLSFDQDGRDVSIRSRYDDKGLSKRWRKHNRMKIRVVVQVPRRYNIDFSSGAGNVDIIDVEGSIDGRTGAGNIVMDGVSGRIDISTGAGNVEVEGDIERAEVGTGAGNISLYGLTGAIEASTGAGNVYAEITRQPERTSELNSGAGNVTVRLADDIGLYVDATASLGSADCEYPLRVEGKWLKKSFEGEINGGGPELRMHSGVGNVSLLRY